MEEKNHGKDTAEQVKRPTRFDALAHLLIGGGVFLLSIGVFTVLVWLAMGNSFSDLAGLDLVSHFEGNVLGLKLFTFFSSSLPLIVAAVVIAILIRASSKDYLLLNRPQNLKWFILAITFVFFAVPLMNPLLELNKLIDFSQWPNLNDWLLKQEASNNNLYEVMLSETGTVPFVTSLIFMALMPALAEEFFFRGFLMNAFNGLFKNMHVAIFLTAFIFSAIHMQFMKVIPMFFLAVVFGYAVYWTRSLWTSIIAHFINNAIAVSQIYFITDGDYTKALEQGQSIPTAVIVVFGLLVAGLFYYMQKNASPKTENFYV